MNRILEFSQSQESIVVPRILIRVHKAIDENFPAAVAPPRQFSKTIFSEEEEETAIQHSSGEKNDVKEEPKKTIPLPPSIHVDTKAAPKSPLKATETPVSSRNTGPSSALSAPPSGQKISMPISSLSPKNQKSLSAIKSGMTFADMGPISKYNNLEEMESRLKLGPDWTTRIAILVFLAGLSSLVYLYFR